MQDVIIKYGECLKFLKNYCSKNTLLLKSASKYSTSLQPHFGLVHPSEAVIEALFRGWY